MKTTLKGKLLMTGLAGVFLTTLAANPAFAQGAGYGMGPGMWNGRMCRMMDVTPQAIAPAALPEPGSPGAVILLSKCTQCHGLVSPGQHASQEWPIIVDRMNRRMWMMSQGRMGMGMMRSYIQPLTPSEKATLIAYLQRNAFRALPEKALPRAGQPGTVAFARFCSRCHALPDPSIHTAAEWPAVLGRMELNMRNMGYGQMTKGQKTAILRYLQENARKR